MTLLELDNAGIGYSGSLILESVDFKVCAQDFHVLHGENGSGKSTFMRSLLGSLTLLSGNRFNDSGAHLGYFPQVHSLDPIFPLQTFEVVEMGLWRGEALRKGASSQRKQFANECLSRVGLESVVQDCFSELSGGQRQKALLARAIASRPDVLLLDEPTASLDAQSRKEFAEHLSSLRDDGVSIVLVTHDDEGWPSESQHWKIQDSKLLYLEVCDV